MKIVVAGLGKTGTTALFFKVKQAMPAGTHCLFEPRGYRAPPVPAEHVLVKDLFGVHKTLDAGSFQSFDRKIVMIRDPRDTLVSRVLYDIYNEPTVCADDAQVDGFVRILRAKEADPSSTPLRDIIRVFDSMARRPILPRATGDAGVALDFQRRHPDFFPYRYEDFVRSDFRTIESYLGFAVAPGTASVPVELERVARTKASGDWRNWLMPADVDFFRPFFTPYLTHNGYTGDWTLPDRPSILPEHGSAYVLRLVGERRRLTPAS